MPIGPIVGGFLLEHFRWGFVFLLNPPLVLIAFVALAVLVREPRSDRPVRVDVIGGVLAVGGLAILSYGLITAGETSWTNGIAIAAILVGLALLALTAGLGFGAAMPPALDIALAPVPAEQWRRIRPPAGPAPGRCGLRRRYHGQRARADLPQ